ncbi:unnamed protein product [Diplocarpon coronariae]
MIPPYALSLRPHDSPAGARVTARLNWLLTHNDRRALEDGKYRLDSHTDDLGTDSLCTLQYLHMKSSCCSPRPKPLPRMRN